MRPLHGYPEEHVKDELAALAKRAREIAHALGYSDETTASTSCTKTTYFHPLTPGNAPQDYIYGELVKTKKGEKAMVPPEGIGAYTALNHYVRRFTAKKTFRHFSHLLKRGFMPTVLERIIEVMEQHYAGEQGRITYKTAVADVETLIVSSHCGASKRPISLDLLRPIQHVSVSVHLPHQKAFLQKYYNTYPREDLGIHFHTGTIHLPDGFLTGFDPATSNAGALSLVQKLIQYYHAYTKV